LTKKTSSKKSKSGPKVSSSKVSSFTREVRKDTLRLKDQMLYSTKLAGNFPEELKDHLESSLQEGVFKMTKEANEVSLMDVVDMVYSI